jgi:hypothetical protein
MKERIQLEDEWEVEIDKIISASVSSTNLSRKMLDETERTAITIAQVYNMGHYLLVLVNSEYE